MTRSSTRSPRLLPVTSGGCVGRASSAGRWPTRFASDALEQAGVGLHQRQVVRHVDVDAASGRRRGRPGRSGTTSSSATGRLTTRQRAGLQPAHVEQVLDQAGQPVQRLVGGEQQLVAVLWRPVDVVAAQAGDRRLRGCQRGAQVVADGGEQRGPHPVALRRAGRRQRRPRSAGDRSRMTAACAAKAPMIRWSSARSGRPRSASIKVSPAGTSVSASSGRCARRSSRRLATTSTRRSGRVPVAPAGAVGRAARVPAA